ncbi:hypothetical protein B0J14DRAFT_21161 [Halenospora varia]|nr:hypothetical protein B0J14DRAFT_21161 [Halenospora varia]
MSKHSRKIRGEITGLPNDTQPQNGFFGSLFKSNSLRKVPSTSAFARPSRTNGWTRSSRLRTSKHYSIPTVAEVSEPRRSRSRPEISLESHSLHEVSRRNLSHSSPDELIDLVLSLQKKLKQTTAELVKERERSESQGKKLTCAQEAILRLEKELEGEINASATAENLKNRAIRQLAEAGTKSDPYQLDDKFFKQKFEGFRYQVANWVRNQKWKPAVNVSLRDGYKCLKTTTPYFLEYVGSESGMYWLLEARIWQFLTEDVFGQNVWADGGIDANDIKKNQKINDIFNCNLEDNVPQEKVELRHEWRAVTARVMAARSQRFTYEALEDNIVNLSRLLRMDLKRFALSHFDTSKSPPDGRTTSIKDIIREAISLDAITQQQRASFCFNCVAPKTPERWNLRFSRDLMDVYNNGGKESLPDDGMAIKLILAPALCKFGTSAGRHYQQRCTIVQAKVLVSEEV